MKLNYSKSNIETTRTCVVVLIIIAVISFFSGFLKYDTFDFLGIYIGIAVALVLTLFAVVLLLFSSMAENVLYIKTFFEEKTQSEEAESK
ncbi:MAG: hypothetical protein Q8862_13485 [Bacteroidota bacterium]|nr:hypothetical protein [Bacteroidota bacterium]